MALYIRFKLKDAINWQSSNIRNNGVVPDKSYEDDGDGTKRGGLTLLVQEML